ncbi:MAG TPA: 16S rRNA (guanine(527)-N(7))-methyltransferase RsmG [Bacteroidales bacterium]|nr:MAG: 16S rRNA (guanine(527)-N(7))-methyltransferase [Bacteroidetes bacterium GWF2_33_38]OFY72037.1 MAG: 16S rRNA (guanine(527)-N(7))-methyltransferase [Bacteroidetes bacterium RIFOXYA12_FULL_33_9]OFY86615.1 MAG: 16S rRNA (guanine(527)-N(7))-methyltransferase [Bacteroidetes bacterium RIFOXYA2_FULL_33_7]HBF89133.1 16S rRNA (guanine(527)-N(7))-methyltransferase RsmG [Bacteroidales bacterium]
MHQILKYFPALTTTQISQFEKLFSLYEDWNSKINVISRKDISQLYERHVLHSLAIAKFITFADNSTVVDIGTGGGFPGIPLAIFFPNVKFTLLDSIRKKITVVDAVKDELKLTNVTTFVARAENVNKQFDFVVSRAVTNFSDFLKLSSNLIRQKNRHEIKNGIIYLKGGDLDNELNNYLKNIKIVDISTFFDEEFFETKKIIYYSK